jgi:predicted DNA-binding transcriptional regulator YafY
MDAPIPRGDQLSRQWRLIQLIDRPQGITVDDAARELACTVRTIWRDLDVPQKAGPPPHGARRRRRSRRVGRDRDFKRALLPKLTLREPVALLMSRDRSPLCLTALGP